MVSHPKTVHRSFGPYKIWQQGTERLILSITDPKIVYTVHRQLHALANGVSLSWHLPKMYLQSSPHTSFHFWEQQLHAQCLAPLETEPYCRPVLLRKEKECNALYTFDARQEGLSCSLVDASQGSLPWKELLSCYWSKGGIVVVIRRPAGTLQIQQPVLEDTSTFLSFSCLKCIVESMQHHTFNLHLCM